MKNLLSSWTKMRIIRLIVGLFLLIHGIYTGEWIWIILGGGFSLLPIFGIGCGCSRNQGGCAVEPNPSSQETELDTIANEKM